MYIQFKYGCKYLQNLRKFQVRNRKLSRGLHEEEFLFRFVICRSPMNTSTLALHVAKRYLDHTLSLVKSTRDAIADVNGFEPHVGDLTVSENNINAAVSNLDNFRVSLKDSEKVRFLFAIVICTSDVSSRVRPEL